MKRTEKEVSNEDEKEDAKESAKEDSKEGAKKHIKEDKKGDPKTIDKKDNNIKSENEVVSGNKDINKIEEEEIDIVKEIKELKALKVDYLKFKHENEIYRQEIEKLRLDYQKYKKSNERYKEINEKYKKDYLKYKEQERKYKIEKEKDLSKIRSQCKKINSLENYINSDISNNSKLNDEFSKAKSDLDLIKIRGGLKAFIDFIYSGLKLEKNDDYESKIKLSLNWLNSYENSETHNTKRIKELKHLLYYAYRKLKKGNNKAHTFDMNKSILDQIIEITRTNKDYNYDDIKKCLKDLNADYLMRELINIRNKYYSNKRSRIECEEKLMSQIPNIKNSLHN